MTRKQNGKVLIWHSEELLPVEPVRGRNLTRIALCAHVVTVNENQDSRSQITQCKV